MIVTGRKKLLSYYRGILRFILAEIIKIAVDSAKFVKCVISKTEEHCRQIKDRLLFVVLLRNLKGGS